MAMAAMPEGSTTLFADLDVEVAPPTNSMAGR